MRLSSPSPAKRVIATAIACGVLLALPGCIPNLRKAEPGPALPPDFNGASSADNSAQLRIDEFFDDPVLTNLIAQALSGNQELKIRNQEVQVAAFEVRRRTGAYLPFLGLRADAGLDQHSFYTPLGAAEEQLLTPKEGHFPSPLPNYLVGLNLFWQIDIWRELRNSRDAAIQRYFGAIENRNYYVTELVSDVAENYFELLALDRRLEILDQTIALQERSLGVAQAIREAGRGTELPVQRFRAEVRRNQSEKLIVRQEIVQAENRINFLLGRYPRGVERNPVNFIDLNLHALSVGVPSQLLRNRRDIREAERELAASGLDVLAARARFFPRLDITANVGFEAFNPRYLFTPDALAASVAGGLVQPLANRRAIQADYCTANSRQLQAIYNYQRVVLNAFTEVVNTVAKVENYRDSIEIKREQLRALEESVEVANRLFQSARVEYLEVLLAQRDLLEARTVLVQTKQQQLAAVVNAYQALGGGCTLSNSALNPAGIDVVPPVPLPAEALPPSPAPAPDGNVAPDAGAAPDNDTDPKSDLGGNADPNAGGDTDPAPEDRNTDPDANGGADADEPARREQSSSRSNSAGRAVLKVSESDRTPVPRMAGRPGASRLVPPPAPLPEPAAGDPFEIEGGGFRRVDENPFAVQPNAF